jgi:hypothetical protein
MADIQITLTISAELYRRAERVAQSTLRAISDVLVDAIALDELDNGDDAGDEAVARERAAFITLHPRLLEQYKGQHVAIHGGRVVDHDVDSVALSLRVYNRYPHEFVWIAPVTSQPVEEWAVRSPRFEPLTS